MGRKRKSTAIRQPDGSVRSWVDPKAVAKAQRIKRKLEKDAGSDLAGFPLGRLFMEGYIEQPEYEAGIAWATLTWNYSRTFGLPVSTPQAVNFNGQRGRAIEAEPDAERVKVLRRSKEILDDRIRSAGMFAARECERVLLHDAEPTDRRLLRDALRALTASNNRHK